MVLKQWGLSKDEHDNCIIDIATEFLTKGFDVYLEYEVILDPKKRKRIVVDVYAKKGREEYVIEVGSLAERTEFAPLGRLRFLKRLMPNAKVIHITQWKNFVTQFDWQDAFDEWYYEKYIRPREAEWIKEMGKSLRKEIE